MKTNHVYQKSASAGGGLGADAPSEWEYVLDDFLELGRFLTDEERILLLGELRASQIGVDSIDIHTAFSIDGRLVVLMASPQIHECWLYYPKAGKIEKYPLKEK